MAELSGYKLPPHRKGFWFSFFVWGPYFGKEEEGFVTKKGKKIRAHFRLSGLGFLRWWELVKVVDE